MSSKEDKTEENYYQSESIKKEELSSTLRNSFKSWLVESVQGPFLKHVSLVALGPLISQALTTVLSPVITRLYSPESYGALGVFLSALSILVPISSLSYHYAIVLPKKDKDGLKILRFIIIYSFILSTVLFILILFLKSWLASLLNLQDFANYLYLLPLALFFSTSAIAYDQWMIRKKQYKASSGIVITQSLLSNGTLIGLGYFLPRFASLIGVNIFARGFHSLAGFLFSLQSIEPQKNEKKINNSMILIKTRLNELLNEYRDFPLFRTPQILISTLSYNLPFMLMTIFSGTAQTGFYSLAHRVLKLPQIVISESVGKVFQQRIAERARQGGSTQPLIIKTTLLLVAIGIIPLGIIILFGPFLFSFIFGAEWFQAGIFARWISVWVLMTFSSVPVVMAIPVLSMQKEYLIFEIVSLITGVLGLIIGFIVYHDPIVAVALFSCISALLLLAWMVYVIIQSKNRNRYEVK
jgi:O-antigen/teichoic acid export membrane protein